MKIYDVTVTLSSQTPLYPGDPAVVIERKQQLDQGDLSNTSYYSFGSHTGTHVDAPSHFVKEGITVDQIPPEWLVGRTRVIEFASGMAITAEHLQEHDLADVMRVLFKTRNSYLWDSGEFVQKYVHLTADAAQYLVESGIKVVGIDYLSVDQYPCEEFTVHQTLLCNGVIIIEGLNLREVEPGDYDMFCLPLKIKDGDGAPARVLLRA